jgi:hypothetical protein
MLSFAGLTTPSCPNDGIARNVVVIATRMEVAKLPVDTNNRPIIAGSVGNYEKTIIASFYLRMAHSDTN